MKDIIPEFKVGQKWEYKTREIEKGYFLTIIRIEEIPNEGVVIHVSIEGLKIRNPHLKKGYSNKILHLPFSKEAINNSVIKLMQQKSDVALSMEGYEQWKRAFEKGQAGIYTVAVAEAIDTIEKTLNEN